MTDTRPQSWKPQRGEILSGTLVEYQQATSKHGDATIAVIRPDDGGLVGVWLGTVLLGKFKNARPAPREVIAIKYVGEVQGKAHSYRDYRLALARNGDALDFSDDGESESRGAAFDRDCDRAPDTSDDAPF